METRSEESVLDGFISGGAILHPLQTVAGERIVIYDAEVSGRWSRKGKNGREK
jgi:hypothetical protein